MSRLTEWPAYLENAAEFILPIGEHLTARQNKVWAEWRLAEGFLRRERDNHRLAAEWVAHLEVMRGPTDDLRRNVDKFLGR